MSEEEFKNVWLNDFKPFPNGVKKGELIVFCAYGCNGLQKTNLVANLVKAKEEIRKW